MTPKNVQRSPSSAWSLAKSQYGVVARAQLLELGYSNEAIKHRVAKGRLHPIHRGVFALGRPELSLRGQRMAAVLACGPGAVLSHVCAAVLYALFDRCTEISISVPGDRNPRVPDLEIHRVELPPRDITTYEGVPVTSPARTLVDLAAELTLPRLERAINEADKRRLITPDALRHELDRWPGRRGVAVLRDLLDRDTFVLTASELERRFLPIARRAGLGKPETGVRVNGFVVDFFWPALGLVVETDGITYHRTPLQQARDRRRDQAHAVAGLTPLRFTHRQVVGDPEGVARILAEVADALRERSA